MQTSNYSIQEWNERPGALATSTSELPWETDFDSKLLDGILGKLPRKYSPEFRLVDESRKNGFWITCGEVSLPSQTAPTLSNLELSNRWLSEHRNEHRGKWVVLDGEHFIGAGTDPTDIVEQARNGGVAVPFVTFIEESSESVWMGWL